MYKQLLVLLLVTVVVTATVHGARERNNGDDQSKVQNFCQSCRSLVSYASKFNSTAHRADYKRLIESFCEQYYPVSTDFQQGPCPMFVGSLFYVLDRIDPINHCDQIGACDNQQPEAPTQQSLLASIQSSLFFSPLASTPIINNNNRIPQVDDDGIVCKVCEQVIQQVKQQLEDPAFIDTLHTQIDNFCHFLKAINEDTECKQILNKNFDNAIDFVRHLDPRKYCKSIQLCPKTAAIKVSLSQSQKPALHRVTLLRDKMPSLVDYTNFGIEENVEKGGKVVKNVAELSSVGNIGGPSCTFCKAFVREMFKFIKDNRTEENIQSGLDKICGLVYKKGEKFVHCEQLVATYSKEMISILADETDPQLICTLIEQCTYQIMTPTTTTSRLPSHHQVQEIALSKQQKQPANSSKSNLKPAEPISMSQFISMLDSSVKVGSMKTCVECKLFVKYMQDSFGEAKSQTEMKDWLLNNLCENLRDTEMKNSCVELVDRYADAFFKAVAEQLNPDYVCVQLKACRPRSGPGIMMRYLNPSIIKQKQDMIIAAINNKNSPTNKTNATVDAPLTATFTSTTITSKPITSTTKITPTITAPVDSRNQPAATTTNWIIKNQSQLCDKCVDFVSKIDEYLSENSINDDVNVLIEQVCNKLDKETSRRECALLVRTFGNDIVQAIATMDNPRQLCSKIALCDNN